MGMKVGWNRRSCLGGLGTVVAAVVAPFQSFGWSPQPKPTGFGASGNVYEELGVTTVINCEGTMTVLGGSLPHPEIQAVVEQAARHYVSIPELEMAAGKRIAQMLKLPQGYSAIVTSGAAAAIQSGLAGILTGDNETFINCEGTMTVLGGSLPHPEIQAVVEQAARHYVSIPELEMAAGKRIAQMLKLPQGYSAIVTSGAAAAIQSGLAGILTGDNETFIRQLPDLSGMKSEVIIQKSHRNPFDHQLRTTGVKLVEIETREQLRRAVNDRTAMMHFSNFANPDGQIKVDEWVKLAKQYNIPCMNDAAADTPPVSHLS